MTQPLMVGSAPSPSRRADGRSPGELRSQRKRQKYLSVVVPTRNERENIEPLLTRLEEALSYLPIEVIFVDDSDDGTSQRIREVALRSSIPASVIARSPGHRAGGLGGAVVEGIAAAEGDWVCVMDGDLQHPPELIPQLLERALMGNADLVLGSRLTAGANAEVLGASRHLISRLLARTSRAMFPRLLRGVSDPMSGFFVVRRSAIDLSRLRPQGFKILLEMLVRCPDLEVAEVPFRFDARNSGQTKAGLREVVRLASLFVRLRLSASRRLQRFVAVGASGFIVNNLLLFLLTELLGLHYLLSAFAATQGSSTWNYAWSARWVFPDRQARGGSFQPLLLFVAMNNAALVLRVPLMFLLTSGLGIHYLLSNIASIAALTLLRFLLADKWIWASTREGLHGYDIHGVLRVVSDVELPELEGFRQPVGEEPIDIRVHVGGRGKRPAESGKGRRAIRYDEGLGPLGFAVEIHAGENIEVWTSSLLRISPHVLYTNVVEPILRWSLVERGYALVHGACVAFDREAYLVTAMTDTGKTTTMLRLLKEMPEGAFLADDLTLITPEGTAYTYPKPLTISRHTVRAVDARCLNLRERLALYLQSKVHSRSGRRTAKLLTRVRLPMATVNAVAQFLVPPPKYPVQRLIPEVRLATGARLKAMFVIKRGEEDEGILPHDRAISTLLRNCEDAYGFPPYEAIEGFLCSLNGANLRAKEEQIVRSAFRSCPAVLLRSKSYGWSERIASLIGSGEIRRGLPHYRLVRSRGIAAPEPAR